MRSPPLGASAPRAVFLALAIALLSSGARAETFSILGKTLRLTPPPEFCELGESSREQALRQQQQRNMAPVGELAQIVLPCDELDAFKAGAAPVFTRWAQVLVSKREGRVNFVTISRAEFIRNSAGNMNTPPDIAGINRRVHDLLSSDGPTVNLSGMQPLGATSQAVFAQVRMSRQDGGTKTPLVAIIAGTVVAQLPILVQVYTTPEATGAPPMKTVNAYLDNLLGAN
jgi:hypothetical protein